MSQRSRVFTIFVVLNAVAMTAVTAQSLDEQRREYERRYREATSREERAEIQKALMMIHTEASLEYGMRRGSGASSEDVELVRTLRRDWDRRHPESSPPPAESSSANVYVPDAPKPDPHRTILWSVRLNLDGQPEAEFDSTRLSTGESWRFTLTEGESGPGKDETLERIRMEECAVDIRNATSLYSLPARASCTAAALIDESWTAQDCHARANSALDRGYLRAAVALYRQGAELGYAKSQANVGVMYLQGRGVARDLAQSKAWLERAAEAGSASAAFNLGLLHEQPETRDIALAKKWYVKATAAGFDRAKVALASLDARVVGAASRAGQFSPEGSTFKTGEPAGAIALPHGVDGMPTFDKIIGADGAPAIFYMGTPVRVGDRVGRWTLRRVDALEEVVVVSAGPTGQAIVAGLRRPRAAPSASSPAAGGNRFDR